MKATEILSGLLDDGIRLTLEDGRLRCKGTKGKLTSFVCRIISENREALIHHLNIDTQFSLEFNESLQELCRYYNEKIKSADGKMMDFVAAKNPKLFQEISLLDDELNEIWLNARLQKATAQEFMEALELWEGLHKIAIDFYSTEFKPHADLGEKERQGFLFGETNKGSARGNHAN